MWGFVGARAGGGSSVRVGYRVIDLLWWAHCRGGSESRSVGGDPAADSPTATLLRLKPPCEAQIRLVL